MGAGAAPTHWRCDVSAVRELLQPPAIVAPAMQVAVKAIRIGKNNAQRGRADDIKRMGTNSNSTQRQLQAQPITERSMD